MEPYPERVVAAPSTRSRGPPGDRRLNPAGPKPTPTSVVLFGVTSFTALVTCRLTVALGSRFRVPSSSCFLHPIHRLLACGSAPTASDAGRVPGPVPCGAGFCTRRAHTFGADAAGRGALGCCCTLDAERIVALGVGALRAAFFWHEVAVNRAAYTDLADTSGMVTAAHRLRVV